MTDADADISRELREEIGALVIQVIQLRKVIQVQAERLKALEPSS